MKPGLLTSDHDIEKISPTYTDDEAAEYIQRAWRCLRARRRVAKLAKTVIQKVRRGTGL